MNNIEILLSLKSTEEEKYNASENIVENYNLRLESRQILNAFNKVLEDKINISTLRLEKYLNERKIFLFKELLKTNTNMFSAIILGLCNNFSPHKLDYFLQYSAVYSLDYTINYLMPTGIGISDFHWNGLQYYINILDYYDFDIENFPLISKNNKEMFKKIRDKKYNGKLTKAVK